MQDRSPPDFDELHACLRAASSGVGAADLHGSLCGFLVAGGGGFGAFLDSLGLAELLAAAQSRDLLSRLYAHTDAELDSDDFVFAPLLPDDDRPLAERTAALLHWCQGFIGGLGLGGLREERTLSADGREVLHDLAEIARSRVSHDADSEVDETALAELTEFARMGTLLLRSELRTAVGQA